MNWKTKRVHIELSDRDLAKLEGNAKLRGFKDINELLQDLLYGAIQEELEAEYVIYTVHPKGVAKC